MRLLDIVRKIRDTDERSFMSTIASEYVQSAQKQTLKTIKQGQQAVVDGIRIWVEAVEKTTSELPAPSTPELPSPQQVLQSGYDFAEQLLKAQREFTESVFAAVEPVFEKLTWKAPTD
jgi:hypothetical protein